MSREQFIVLQLTCNIYTRLRSCPTLSKTVFPTADAAFSAAIPHPRDLRPPDLVLQLEDTIQQRLSGRRTPRNINIHGNDTIDSPQDTIAVVVISSTIGTAAHADHPLGIRHLVVKQPDGRRHLVADGAGDDHHIRLAWGCAEDDAQAVLVVSRH
jgi:hypothetical protein